MTSMKVNPTSVYHGEVVRPGKGFSVADLLCLPQVEAARIDNSD